MTRSNDPATLAMRGPALPMQGAWPRRLRRLGAAAAVAASLVLAGCGGGADVGVGVEASPGVNVGVVVGNTTYAPVSSGQVLDVVADVGQSVAFDANEPVVWSFSVNGSPLFTTGTTVDVGGVTIGQVQFSPSRVVLESNFYGLAQLPIDVLLTATSTFDSAQVATIHLRLR